MIRLLRYDLPGFLMASRIPNLLVIGATQYFTALFLVADYAGKTEMIVSLRFFLMVSSTVMIAAGGYIINDYYDQKIDMINRPDRVVVGVLFRRRLAMLAHMVLTLGGIVLGFLLDDKIGLIHIFSSFALWLYSNQLRRLTLLGNFLIAMLTGLTLFIVTVYLGRLEPVVYAYSLFAMAIILIREVIKDIEDVKGESAVGCQSIPVIWGIRGAKLFIFLVALGSGAMLLSWLVLVDHWPVRVYFTLLLPLFGWFLFRLIRADRQQQFARLRWFTNAIILSGLVSMLLMR